MREKFHQKSKTPSSKPKTRSQSRNRESERAKRLRRRMKRGKENFRLPKTESHRQPSSWHRCDACGKKFKSESKLAVHQCGIKCTAIEKAYACKKCPMTFPMLKLLKQHRKVHAPNEFVEVHTFHFDDTQEIYICNTCSAEFKELPEVEQHTKSHTETFECSICSRKFQTLLQLGTHLKSHDDDGQICCPMCEQKFAKPSLLVKHIDQKHLKKYMHSCATCGKGFHSVTLWRQHMNVHLGLKPFTCIVCDAKFTYSKSVVTHQLKMHRVEILGRDHGTECSFCRNRFLSKTSLERHIELVHTGPQKPKEMKYLCDTCGKAFSYKNKMVVHMRTHTGYKPYACKFCGKRFSKSGEKNCHQRIHTGERPYSCEYCGKSFRQSAPFKVHLRTHTGERPYVCDLCTKGFTTNQGLKLHKKNCGNLSEFKRTRKTRRTAVSKLQIHHELNIKKEDSDSDSEYVILASKSRRNRKNAQRRQYVSHKSWPCKKCSEVFATFRQLKIHRKTHVRVETFEKHTYAFAQDLYVCNTCSAEFQEKNEVEDHIKNHENQFRCANCHESFKTAYQLGCHSSAHNEDGNVNCPLCSYKSAKRGALLIHINYVHLKKFAYFCETCGKGFNDHLIYKEHNNEHLGVKPFVCVVCDKSFTYTRYLNTHQVRTHRVPIDGQLLPNQCPYCNKHYSKPESLEKHLDETHFKTGPHEKKHLCDTCGKGFAQRSKLIIHERVHTGFKPYGCSYCEKSFTKKDYLVMHERVHSGEKPYSCGYCGKCFSQAAPLRIHLRIHTGEKPYVCHFCGSGFTSRGALNMHYEDEDVWMI
ncbi:zinc finger protein 585A-like [Cylas formicarius]|uniref:zinc finger protein 585A-like n=1 Tax=Cylas formicarius TaxID=197179 RepID=UPI002958BC1D|nr:zinc finger protein 585A-like [Cylas formicarius]